MSTISEDAVLAWQQGLLTEAEAKKIIKKGFKLSMRQIEAEISLKERAA